MFQDQKEELNRLESALLEQEESVEEQPQEEEEAFFDDSFELEDFEEEPEEDEEEILSFDPEETRHFKAYSNHKCDVDLEEFSQDVAYGKKEKGMGFLVALFVFLTLAICACLFLFLKDGGFLG